MALKIRLAETQIGISLAYAARGLRGWSAGLVAVVLLFGIIGFSVFTFYYIK